jgi:uncharacterized protein (TIGR01777 family)
MNVAVGGASGLIGSALCARLGATGHATRALPRGDVDGALLDGVDAVVHLGGANIAERRWSRARKQELRDSRVLSTARLARALAERARPPSLLLCASGIGYYGARSGDIDESAPRGDGFLAELCEAWEAAADPARAAGIRVVHARFGLVLSTAGGALGKQLPLFRRGLGVRLGDGSAPLSWIAMHDTLAALELLLSSPSLAGAFNLTAPAPVTQDEFATELARALGTHARLRMPAPLLRLALGELADSLLTGARVLPTRLVAAGFRFRYPTLPEALSGTLVE